MHHVSGRSRPPPAGGNTASGAPPPETRAPRTAPGPERSIRALRDTPAGPRAPPTPRGRPRPGLVPDRYAGPPPRRSGLPSRGALRRTKTARATIRLGAAAHRARRALAPSNSGLRRDSALRRRPPPERVAAEQRSRVQEL